MDQSIMLHSTEEEEDNTELFGGYVPEFSNHLTMFEQFDESAPYSSPAGPLSSPMEDPLSILSSPPSDSQDFNSFRQPPSAYYQPTYTGTPPTTPEGDAFTPQTSPLDSQTFGNSPYSNHTYGQQGPYTYMQPSYGGSALPIIKQENTSATPSFRPIANTTGATSHPLNSANTCVSSNVAQVPTSSTTAVPGQSGRAAMNSTAPVALIPGPKPEEAAMYLTLSHKPRGSGGVWKSISEGTGLRVTKDKGKRLRLHISCNFDFDWAEVTDITLFDHVALTDARTGFSMDLSKCTLQQNSATIELTLTRICKKLQFLVTLTSKYGWTCKGRTVGFMAHNNGKENARARSPLSKSPEPEPTMNPTTTLPPYSLPIVKQQPRGASASSPITLSNSDPLQPEPATKKRKAGETGEIVRQDVTTIRTDLEVAGTVRARDFIQYSDLRLKTDIKDVVDALSIVQQLQPKTYEWKEGAFAAVAAEQNANAAQNVSDKAATGGRRLIGLIAQEVQKTVPDAVHTDPVTGLLSVSYIDLLPILIQALKEHLGTYHAQQADVSTQLLDLQQKIEALSLQSPTPSSPILEPSEQDLEREVAAENAWNESVGAIRDRTNDFKQLSSSDLSLLAGWAEHLRDKSDKKQRRQMSRQKRKEENVVKKKEEKAKKKSMLDPIRVQSAVLRLGERMYRPMNKRNAKLAIILFWKRNEQAEELALLPTITSEDNHRISVIRMAKENMKEKWVVVGVTGEEDKAPQCNYRVAVEILKGDVTQLQASQAVVAVFDYSHAGQTPLWVASSSIVETNGKYWLVGTFQLPNLKWISTPNSLSTNLPTEWRQDVIKTATPIKQNGPLTHEPRPVSPLQMREAMRIFLRSKNNYYLSCSDSGEVSCITKESGGVFPHIKEAWEVEYNSAGITLRAHNGRYLRRILPAAGSAVLAADIDEPSARNGSIFFPLIDEHQSAMSFIAYDDMYIFSDAHGNLASSPLKIPLQEPTLTKSNPQAMPMGSSLELYDQLSKGALGILPEKPQPTSSSHDFFSFLRQGSEAHGCKDQPTVPVEDMGSSVDLNGSLELYRQLGEGASKAIPNGTSTSGSLAHTVSFSLPRPDQQWFVELAPALQAQQAQQLWMLHQSRSTATTQH